MRRIMRRFLFPETCCFGIYFVVYPLDFYDKQAYNKKSRKPNSTY